MAQAGEASDEAEHVLLQQTEKVAASSVVDGRHREAGDGGSKQIQPVLKVINLTLPKSNLRLERVGKASDLDQRQCCHVVFGGVTLAIGDLDREAVRVVVRRGCQRGKRCLHRRWRSCNPCEGEPPVREIPGNGMLNGATLKFKSLSTFTCLVVDDGRASRQMYIWRAVSGRV